MQEGSSWLRTLAHSPPCLLPNLARSHKEGHHVCGCEHSSTRMQGTHVPSTFPNTHTYTHTHRAVPCPPLGPTVCVHSLEKRLGKEHIQTLRVGSGPLGWGGILGTHSTVQKKVSGRLACHTLSTLLPGKVGSVRKKAEPTKTWVQSRGPSCWRLKARGSFLSCFLTFSSPYFPLVR